MYVKYASFNHDLAASLLHFQHTLPSQCAGSVIVNLNTHYFLFLQIKH